MATTLVPHEPLRSRCYRLPHALHARVVARLERLNQARVVPLTFSGVVATQLDEWDKEEARKEAAAVTKASIPAIAPARRAKR